MADLAPIVLILLAGSVGYAIFLWNKLRKFELEAKDTSGELEERKEELEKTRRELKDRREDAEQTKKLLQEARNKLKKQDKAAQEKPGAKRDKSSDTEAAAPMSAAAVVRISDSQLEEEHRRAKERLESALGEAKREIAEMKRKEAELRREAERASESLATASRENTAPAPAEPRPAPPAGSDEVASLKGQLEAMKRAAVDREKELRRELRKSQEAGSSAIKRATNNHQLYQVIKGQLELAEDRLAALRRKYEGAMTPDELRREQKKAARTRGTSNGGTVHPEPETNPPIAVPPVAPGVIAGQASAPSTLEVSKEQIVASEPIAEPAPSPPPAAEE
jgi:hypothetical protein